MTQKKNLGIETITLIAAMLLVMLFGYTALSKLNDYKIFVLQMSKTLPPFLKPFNSILGWLLPLVELIIVGLLLFDRWRQLGLYLSFFLLLIFEVFILGMLLSGLELGCSCGGVISKLSWKEHLLFNAFFMLIALFPFLYTSSFIRFILQNIRHSRLWE